MFRPGRGSDQSKIRLPKQNAAPGVKELQSLYEQARENRAREVELVWQVPGTYKSFSIHVKFDRVTPHPVWNIWENDGRESKMVWRFETSDVHMIYDVVAMLEVAHQKTTGTVQTVQSTGSFNPTVSGQFGTRQGMPAMSPPATQTQSNRAPNSADGWRTVDPQTAGQNSASFQTQPQAAQAQPPQNFQNPGPSAPPQSFAASGFNQPLANNGHPVETPSGSFAQAIQKAATTSGSFSQYQPNASENLSASAAGNFQQPNANFPPPNAGFASGSFKQVPQSAAGMGVAPTAQHMPDGTLPADFFSDAPATIAAAPVKNTSMEGSIETNPMNNVLTTIGMQQLTGKLEIAGPAAVGHVYFENGIPKDAQTSNNRGDEAIKELVTWRNGNFLFKPSVRTEMHSVEKSLQTSVLEGIALLDQLKHLEKAGLVYESILSQKQKNLGEPELKLMLSKGVQLDFGLQKEVYEGVKHKTTFTDLLRDRPMEQTQWAPLLFNLLYCGLIEIKPPAATRGGALDFLGESKQIIQNLGYNFVRTDTGLMSCESLLYFMEYEYYRYDAYNWPMSLVVFELMLKRTGGSGIIEKDALPVAALNTAATRIGLVKRPLDTLAHFYGQDFAILMPNTRASQAAFVANRVLDALTVTPLAPGIDKANLSLAFGVANLPADGEDLESLIQAAVDAHAEAKEGTFPIVLARTSKRD